MSSWAEYAEERLAAYGREYVADAMGMDQSGFSRWKKNPPDWRPPADAVINFARAVKDDPVALLVRFGYLRQSEVSSVVELQASASDLEAEALLIELARRLNVRLIREGRRGA